jgi:hypothetical protein
LTQYGGYLVNSSDEQLLVMDLVVNYWVNSLVLDSEIIEETQVKTGELSESSIYQLNLEFWESKKILSCKLGFELRVEIIRAVILYQRRLGRNQFDIHKLSSVCESNSGTVAMVDKFKDKGVKWVDEA